MKPGRPETGSELQSGYDLEIYNWIEELEGSAHLLDRTLDGRIKRVAGGSGGTSKYNGPFAVTEQSGQGAQPTGVVLLGPGQDRATVNQVILGLATRTVEQTELNGLGASYYVFLDITWTGTEYQMLISTETSLPAQSATHYVIPIAYVEIKDSAVASITQLQYGSVQGSGRVFKTPEGN